MLSILYYFLGVILLLLGRKLYWFFTAVAGMLVGIFLSGILVDAENLTWQIIFAVIGAILGAVLAIVLQKIAIAIVGFLAGGLGATFLWRTLELPSDGNLELVPFIIGGVIAAILAIWAFEYGLIILTSWGGATLISQELQTTEFNNTGWVGIAVFLGMFVAGVVIQAVAYAGERKKPQTP